MESVISEIRGNAMWITLNRPDALNALTPAIISGINTALDKAPQSEARAVVLTGTGRAFCAGADLKFVRGEAGNDETALGRFLDTILLVMNRLETFPMPVIAALNGLTLAGGLELMLCCDLVIAARSARLGDAHANYGLLPGGGSSVRLPRKIGPTRAKYLLYTGEFVPADGEIVQGDGWALQAVATPGHTANHMAFAWRERSLMFVGDHVMGWSTTIVVPPDGAMIDYMASLEKLAARPEQLYFPGHGPEIPEGPRFTQFMIRHRRAREASILHRLAKGEADIPSIVRASYIGIDPRLVNAAGYSVLAHLEDMVERGIVATDGAPTIDKTYRLLVPLG